MPIGTASESLNEWADEEAGLEAVQRILDSLDDIYALQDAFVDPEVLRDMLRDVKLHALLQVSYSTSFVVNHTNTNTNTSPLLICYPFHFSYLFKLHFLKMSLVIHLFVLLLLCFSSHPLCMLPFHVDAFQLETKKADTTRALILNLYLYLFVSLLFIFT